MDLTDFIIKHKHFWWWVPQESLSKLNIRSIVEGTLNYGDIPEIKELFEIAGIERVAKIFNESITRSERDNYIPITKHFFNLYFQRHVPWYSDQRTNKVNPIA